MQPCGLGIARPGGETTKRDGLSVLLKGWCKGAQMRLLLPIICVCCLVLCLSACAAYTPPLSMYKLSQIDMMKTDLAEIRVAVRLPAGLRPVLSKIKVEAGRHASKHGPAVAKTFSVVPVNDRNEQQKLASEMKRGFKMHVYKLSSSDAKELAKFREETEALKARGDDPQGYFSVGAGACLTGDLSPASWRMTTYARFEKNGEYIPLVRDYDIRADLEAANGGTFTKTCVEGGK